MIIKNNIQFRFTKRGAEPGIEILYGQGKEFWSCERGTDLFDFDALLEYFVPNIDFEGISYNVARWWEQELYRLLAKCKQHRTRAKAFSSFCGRLKRKYGKEHIHLEGVATQSLMMQLEKTISDKMGFIKKDYKISRMSYCEFAYRRISA